jgi:hypothetical protein
LNIFQDFNEATYAVSFFIDVRVQDWDWDGDIGDDDDGDNSFENIETKEKLVIKKVDWQKFIIGRYPLEVANDLIEAHEKEIAEWNSEELGRKITLMDGLTI